MASNHPEENMGLLNRIGHYLHHSVSSFPLVTVTLIAAQTAIFLNIFPSYYLGKNAACISAYLVWHHSQWRRLFLAPFYHVDEMHLYYNMVSFFVKGYELEKKLGSMYFAYLLTAFTAASSAVYVGLSMLLENVLEDSSYATTCSVGFSGVIFALKVLTIHYSPPGTQYTFGYIPVPSPMVYWFELVIIQMAIPTASFTGHLAGILVGLLYVRGPLKNLMDIIMSPGQSYIYTAAPTGYRSALRHVQNASSVDHSRYHYSNDERRPKLLE